LELPAKTDVVEQKGQQSTDHNAAGKPDMEPVELGCFVVREERGDQGIAGSLDGTVRDAKDQGAGIEAAVVPGKDGEQDARQMTDEGDPHDGG